MILGVDPGLANVGWAVLSSGGSLHSWGHIETHKEDRTGDAAARLAEVMYGLSTPLRLLQPTAIVADYVGIEWPTGGFGGPGPPCPTCHKPRGNAGSAVQTGTTAGSVYGAAYWLLRGHTERILRPTSTGWRAALARAWGCERDEEAVHAAIVSRHPQLATIKKKQRHAIDGVGVAEYVALQIQKGP